MTFVRLRIVGCWVAAVTLTLSAVVGLSVPAAAAANPWPHTVVNGFSTPSGAGFWLTYADGAVVTSGDAAFHGSANGLALRGPIVGGATTPAGGYWLVASDGGIFSYAASFYGSMGAARLNQPVFSMAATHSGRGYWLVARDGGIFSFGDARFHGSTGGIRLNQPIDGITTSPTGGGYRMVARDGGIFSFGDAVYYGSLPGRGVRVTDTVGMAPTPTGKGYWIARSGGGVYAFGDAHALSNYHASECDPITAIFSNPKSQGYRLVTRSGATLAFGAAPGGTHATGTPHSCSPGLIPLTIAAQSHQSTYNRDAEFGGFIDISGCKDTRAIVLIHDSLAPVTYTTPSQCTVATGRWIDPWSGVTTSVASAFQIDHTVPLANAWYSGAWAWTQSQRVAYTNDYTDADHLVPILTHENESKGDSGPDAWKPPASSSWCRYALDWDHIKAKWHLTATPPEWAAVTAMAATC